MSIKNISLIMLFVLICCCNKYKTRSLVVNASGRYPCSIGKDSHTCFDLEIKNNSTKIIQFLTLNDTVLLGGFFTDYYLVGGMNRYVPGNFSHSVGLSPTTLLPNQEKKFKNYLIEPYFEPVCDSIIYTLRLSVRFADRIDFIESVKFRRMNMMLKEDNSKQITYTRSLILENKDTQDTILDISNYLSK